MSGVLAVSFPEAVSNRDPDKFNIRGLPRISDAEHYKRALDSGRPHSYISARAGHIEYQDEDGLGFFNAVDLHVKIMMADTLIVPTGDINQSLRHNSFYAALEKIGFDKLPTNYVQAIGAEVCRRTALENL